MKSKVNILWHIYAKTTDVVKSFAVINSVRNKSFYCRRHAMDTILLELRPDQGHSCWENVRDTLRPKDVSTHQMWD